jgi:hypothetical protein
MAFLACRGVGQRTGYTSEWGIRFLTACVRNSLELDSSKSRLSRSCLGNIFDPELLLAVTDFR